MTHYNLGVQYLSDLQLRRKKLRSLYREPVVFFSGTSSSRNYPASTFPFRASSHFLYFCGLPIENAIFAMQNDKTFLFLDDLTPEDKVWHGEQPSRQYLAEYLNIDENYPLKELKNKLNTFETIPLPDAGQRVYQESLLERKIGTPSVNLLRSLVECRLQHDNAALAEIREATKITAAAHTALMHELSKFNSEAQARSFIEGKIFAESMRTSYESIVTINGEILHNPYSFNRFEANSLLLVDVGAETRLGYAGDITRTLPVSGRFTSSQKEIYNIVLTAVNTCMQAVKPGVEFLDLHLTACKVIIEGLKSLRILKGDTSRILEVGAHALFFSHGLGHLLGLDVHDMEDLGDIAGYAESRVRSKQFGLSYLRLNRKLLPNMAVTIEPGIYFNKILLNSKENQEKFKDYVDFAQVEKFSEVKGIRLENDILVTENGSENLTVSAPITVTDVESLMKN